MYSYGILLLEMLTGKRPTEETFGGEFNLQKWVQAAIPDEVLRILDDELREDFKNFELDHLVSVVEIGLLCARERPEMRPGMKDVSLMIRRTWKMIFGDAINSRN